MASDIDSKQRAARSLGGRVCAPLALFLVLEAVPLSAAAVEYFRYENDQGLMVIDSVLPPKYAPRGYSIINEHGMVLRVVEPQLSEEEYLAKKQADEQRARDQRLLMRYSSMDDIDSAERRFLDELEIRLSILRSNVKTLAAQIERDQELAAIHERAGREVPQKLLDNIEALQAEQKLTRANIVARQAEVTQVEEDFASKKQRFAELKPQS